MTSATNPSLSPSEADGATATGVASRPGARTRQHAVGAGTIGAIGVVFGDIGTSPIYTIQTIFNPGDPIR